MRLSILILTHNRPTLFQRCIQSVLKDIPNDVEVIVNNDSCDIVEIPHPSVSYYYNKYEHLSDIYKFLLQQASGEYVYYLEDDDYLVKHFDTAGDLLVGNYMPMYDCFYRLDAMTRYKNNTMNGRQFLRIMNSFTLQLSQFVFKKSIIDGFTFPADSNVYNDEKLVRYACNQKINVVTKSIVLYYQTIDGGDNISFPKYNHEYS